MRQCGLFARGDIRASPDARRMEMVEFHCLHDMQVDELIFHAFAPPWYTEPPAASFWVEACTKQKLSIGKLVDTLTSSQVEQVLNRDWPETVKFYYEIQHAKGDVLVIQAAQEPWTSYNLTLKHKPKLVLYLLETVILMLELKTDTKTCVASNLAKISKEATTSTQIRATPDQFTDFSAAMRKPTLTSASIFLKSQPRREKSRMTKRDYAASLTRRLRRVSIVMPSISANLPRMNQKMTLPP